MNILKKLVAASAGALIVFQTLVASAAIDAYLWVNGPHGEIDGQAKRDRTATQVLQFTHGLTKPGDLRAAFAAGKQIHEPITLLMKVDHATSLIWKAVKPQDRLQLRLAFYRPAVAAISGTPAAEQKPYYELTFGDAMVEKLDAVSPDDVQDPGSKAGWEYVRIRFTFQKIAWSYPDGGTTFSDDWYQSM